MKILHTSDWHLGHRLYERERRDEQKLALEWLCGFIDREGVEILIVAGDIFDLANPPNYAREQYYDFLGQLKNTSCRQVIIIGGNHDSPSMLDAPAVLFRYFNIHVVGAISDSPSDQIVPLHDSGGQAIGWVAAVPFLRDRDLRYSIAGQTPGEREQKLQEGIRDYYRLMAEELASKTGQNNQLLIATGHLYARGAQTASKQDNIYIGSRENILAEQFPEIFDYVALGHIHRPQKVGGQDRIRYSGSLIPLDFSETGDQKSVVVIDYDVGSPLKIQLVEVPVFRRLKSVAGTLNEVEQKLKRFLAKRQLAEHEPLEPWLEIRIQTDKPIPSLADRIQQLIDGRPADVLAIRLERTPVQEGGDKSEVLPQLDELDPEQVFVKLISGHDGQLPENGEELIDSFRALRDWHSQQKVLLD
ncbi:MAG: exonuclease SbcCD subunit D C-terminal domain-containing protein [Bacteroidota bacterium]